jgi:hypothetical protein
MNYPRIILKKGREAPLRHGHPWVFSGAVAKVEGGPGPGDIVHATDSIGRGLGLGFFNTGDIAFRLLTGDSASRIDADFWRRRIDRAVAMRKKVVPPETDAYRLINAEGDWMPGLVVDRYGSFLVFSIGTAGMEKWRETLIGILSDTIGPVGIYERSEGRSRQLEGLSSRIGPAAGDVPAATEIAENGLRFEVDLIAGQKTGYQPWGRSSERLFLHRRLFRLCRPWGGETRCFRRCFSGGQRDRLPKPRPERFFFRAAPDPHGQLLRISAGNGGDVRSDHSGPSGIRQVAEGGGPVCKGLQGDQPPGGEASSRRGDAGHLFLLQSGQPGIV